MSFCSSCGTKLEGDERFCVKCGHDVKGNGAAVPAVAASAPIAVASVPAAAPQVVAPPPQSYPPPPPQGYAAPPPQGYVAPPVYPGQSPIPIVMGVPPAQSKRHGWIWVVVIIAVLYGLYYIGTHNQKTQQQPQVQPAQPGQPVAGGQPGTPGQQGGGNATLAQMQSFTGQVGESNGQVLISNGQWTNNATVAVQSVTLECIQYNANGSRLTQTQNILNGPVQPQSSTSFNPFHMGAVVQGATRAQCGIVGATAAN